ncbi:hypothetical protein [Moorena producens]|uniref:hypothetical protein n=1 Tax=Moorena producens TaxID=1155739 RepID=UPI003C75F282
MISVSHNCEKLYIRYTGFFHYSLFPAPCSLLPAPYSLLPKTQKFVPHQMANRCNDQSILNTLQSRR